MILNSRNTHVLLSHRKRLISDNIIIIKAFLALSVYKSSCFRYWRIHFSTFALLSQFNIYYE